LDHFALTLERSFARARNFSHSQKLIMEELTPTPSSRSHGLIIGLLFALLLGTLVAVALLVLEKNGPDTNPDLAIACEEQVADAVSTTIEDEQAKCQELRRADAEEKMGEVPAREGTLGFSYPQAWSATTTTSPSERVTWRASLVPGYFTFCEACDGPFIDISMQVGSLTDPAIVAQPTFLDYLETIYTAQNGFSEVSISHPTDNEKRYTITGKLDGLFSGDFETIYYVGTTNWASAFYVDQLPGDTTSNEGWEIVKGSLNFSGIK
jgi:hypothetical protein